MVTITSIRKLEKDEIEKVKKAFDIKENDQINFKIDKSLIGGIQVKKDGILFDGSVKNQLDKLKQKLYKRVI